LRRSGIRETPRLGAQYRLSDLPDEKPRITGIKEKYQIGETLEALCTSWQSHPPANLTWWINEEKVTLRSAGFTSWPQVYLLTIGDCMASRNTCRQNVLLVA